jgi:hypothetical protein
MMGLVSVEEELDALRQRNETHSLCFLREPRILELTFGISQ